MLVVCEIDEDVLGVLALLDEDSEMREIILTVVDPLVALGPRFDFEKRGEMEVPQPYAQVDLGKAWEACREDAHACKAMLEGDHSLEATLIAYRTSVQWSRFWSERFPSSEWRMRFWQSLVRLEEGLDRLRIKAGWRLDKAEIMEGLSKV